MTPQEYARLLGGGEPLKGAQGTFTAYCPAHNDTRPSLHVAAGDKRAIILRCRAGCAQTDVIAALVAQKLWPPERASGDPIQPRNPAPAPKPREDDWTPVLPAPADAPPPAGIPRSIARYTYRDAEGRLLFCVDRVPAHDGERKQFWPSVWCSHPTQPAQWRRKHAPPPRPIYGLDRLAAKPNAPVVINEGEKKADAIERMVPEFVGVAWSAGAGNWDKTDWTPLRGRTTPVYIAPDNDGPGRAAATGVASALAKLDLQAVIVRIPAEFPAGWDLADAEGGPGWTPARVKAFIEVGSTPPTDDTPKDDGSNPFFAPLGVDGSTYHYRRIHNPQLIVIASSKHASPSVLYDLAPITYWESLYPTQTGADYRRAASDVMEACKRRVYNPDEARGRGAWLESDGRLVYHTGGSLIVGGKRVSLDQFQSRYWYVAKGDLGLDFNKPLTDGEGVRVAELISRLHWRRAIDAHLLTGWITIAPFCGALRWRPSIWITGVSGAGKSTVIKEIVQPLVAVADETSVDGPTSASGLRSKLRDESLPILFDEMERHGSGSSEARVQELIELIMITSSGEGRVLKGTPAQGNHSTRIRTMWALGSINTARDFRAAARRITPLELLKADPKAWPDINSRLANLPPGERLIARTYRMFNVLRRNIAVASDALMAEFGSQTEADQLSPMMGGYFSLLSSQEVTLERAGAYIVKHRDEITEQIASADDRDEAQLLHTFANYLAHIRVRSNGSNPAMHDRTVAELVAVAAGLRSDPDILRADADIALRRMGVAVSGEDIFVAHKNSELARVFQNTQWAKNWVDGFCRMPSAIRGAMSPFAGGRSQRAVRIPLDAVIASQDRAA